MVAFGKCAGGGRRSAPRAPAPVLTVISTLTKTHSAVLEDVSCRGARLRGAHLPGVGEGVVLQVEGVQVFATVIWSEEDVCGLEFDGGLAPALVERLQRLGSAAIAVGLTPEETAALREWHFGSPR